MSVFAHPISASPRSPRNQHPASRIGGRHGWT